MDNRYYYSTDSEDHLINIGERQEPQWDDLTSWELNEDLVDSFNDAIHQEDLDKAYIQDILQEDVL